MIINKCEVHLIIYLILPVALYSYCSFPRQETGINAERIMIAMESGEQFLKLLKSRLSGDRKELFEFVCKELMNVNGNYNWVGIYVVKGEKLVLDTFAGEKTEHNVISIGDGLCSKAIVTNAIVNEPDVTSNSDYLACFRSTRSELVVPIRDGQLPIGELDLDSNTASAFNKEDEVFLADVGELISGRVREIYSKE